MNINQNSAADVTQQARIFARIRNVTNKHIWYHRKRDTACIQQSVIVYVVIFRAQMADSAGITILT